MNPLNALQEAIHYSFITFCIYCFFPVVGILCALHLESRKNYQHGLDAGPLEFQFLPQFESILDGHLSRHLLPAPFSLKIENTT